MSVPPELLQNLSHAKHQVMLEAANLMSNEELLELRNTIEKLSDEELVELLGKWYLNLYKREPVGVREWVESGEYMNRRGQMFPKLLDDFEEMFSGQYDEAVLCGAIGWGKCKPGHSVVTASPDGVRWSRVTLQELVEQQAIGWKIKSVDPVTLKIVTGTVNNAAMTGTKPVYRLTLGSGLVCEATTEHPVMVDGGYTRFDQLKKGDLVATARTLSLPGNELPKSELLYAAYMFAEGCTTNYPQGQRINQKATFTNQDPEILAEFRQIVSDLGGKEGYTRVVNGTHQISVLGLNRLLDTYQLAGKKATEKALPDSILFASEGNVRLFLSRFISCDGHLEKYAHRIEITLGSKQLVDDLRFLFTRLGIPVTVKAKIKTSSKQGKELEAWTLRVSGDEASRFLREVPLIGEKRKQAEVIASRSVDRPSSNNDVVPIDYAKAKQLRSELGGLSKAQWKRHFDMPKGQYLSRAKLERAKQELGWLPAWADAYLTGDVFWDRVVSVEPLGEMPVYDLEVPETHNFLSDGVVVHNSYMAGMALCRMVYEVSCLTNPQLTYGLSEGTQIAFMNVATNFTTAKEVVFDYVKVFVESSPYFKKHFPLEKSLERELGFPGNIRIAPVASTQNGILGQNMFGGVLDEANFMQKVVKSNRSRSVVEEYDHARVLHNAMIRRMKSRFMQLGKLPGMLLIVSSALYPDDFTELLIQESEKAGNKRMFIRRYSQWEPKPKHFYSGERFLLALGNQTIQPRVLRQPEESDYETRLDDPETLSKANVQVIDVPVEYRSDFLRDIDMAIRDIAGWPTLAKHPFFRDTASIERAVERGEAQGLAHPYSHPVVVNMDEAFWNTDLLDFDKTYLPHFVHVDLSLNGDGAGISVVRLDEVVEREVIQINQLGEEVITTEWVPMMSTVLMLRVVPPHGGEIDIAKIRHIILQLIEWGFYIQTVSYDQYNSAESIQQFQHMNIESLRVSVDRTMEPYNTLKEVIYEERLAMYRHEHTINELVRLERDVLRGKIDHPPRGCFTGDTRVALLDGTLPTFKELAQRFPNGEPFPVYSMRPDGICVGWGRNPRITREDAELVEVVLDNYQVIRCTPDHLFMTIDGEWVQAQHLTRDVSIMPLYRSRSSDGGWAGYERLWCPHRDERLMTHQLVAEQFYGPRKRKIVHHKNEVKHDNRPENLVYMGRRSHLSHHTTKRHKEDSEYVEKLREGHRAYRENGGNEKSRQNIERLFAEGKIKRGRDACAIEGCDIPSDAKGLCGKHYQRMRRAKKKAERTSNQNNHRILSVRPLEERADVWDITVDEYHNFALASGVFVHNSKDVADALAGATYSCTVFVRDNPSLVTSGVLATSSQKVSADTTTVIDKDSEFFDEWGWMFDSGPLLIPADDSEIS